MSSARSGSTETASSFDAESSSAPVEDGSLELILLSGLVPLGFVREADLVFLVGRERSARWPVEILRTGAARLKISGRTELGSTELISDPVEKQRVLELFQEKYGPRRFARWYGDPARVLRVHLGAAGPPSGGDEQYHGWLSAEFDNVAEDYDRHILGNRINRLLRDRSLAELRRTFVRSPRLLEIGCGSGMETLPLLGEGHEVFCVDLSERMLEVVRQKARRDGVSERLRTERLAAASIPRLLEELGPGAFDGAYSTYGALNCEAELASIPPALHGLVRSGGKFVAGVYNRWCAFELLGYSLTGQFGRAFGRFDRPVRVGSSRFCVDIYAHSEPTFARTFAPWFLPERIVGVPVLLPPSDLVGYAEKFDHGFNRLDRWDRFLSARWPFRYLGDHFLMTMRRAELMVPPSPTVSVRAG
ncbi:MAG: methyltransferase domain-containing protein [Thermoplasmata archaeon]|nr:methyltransferase domain-containing protein [Thermoplasmata archaeon]